MLTSLGELPDLYGGSLDNFNKVWAQPLQTSQFKHIAPSKLTGCAATLPFVRVPFQIGFLAN
jgi:hypothetical protein